MDMFLQKTPMEQRLFIEEAAARTGMAPVVLEKDFWVCWMLGQLFALPEISEHLTFKGGTSLSKVYGVIQRFSEDIDLAIHRDHLGFGGDEEPEKAGTNKERKRRLEALSDACTDTVRENFFLR